MSPEAAPAAAPPLDPRWCPLCALDDAAHVTTEGDRRVVRCRRCGLAYLYPRPSPEELRAFYGESYYATADAGQKGFVDYARHETSIRMVARRHIGVMGRYTSTGRLLDVGCAYGYFLDEARQAGWDVTGVEISPQAAAAARDRFGVAVHAGTLEAHAFPDAAFDAVTLWDCLEHTVDPVGMLEEVHRVLRPGGCCFLTLPDASTWVARLLGRHWFGYRKAGEHTLFFTRSTMRAALARVHLLPLSVGRGVWPCDLEFLAEKFAQYSPAVSRLGQAVLRSTGLGRRVMRFPFIDMLVVAQRPAT